MSVRTSQLRLDYPIRLKDGTTLTSLGDAATYLHGRRPDPSPEWPVLFNLLDVAYRSQQTADIQSVTDRLQVHLEAAGLAHPTP